jgi:hypothetical protein
MATARKTIRKRTTHAPRKQRQAPAAPPVIRTGEAALTRNQIVQELTRSLHGQLSAYVPVGVAAASQDPEFFAHLIAWNEKNGQVRDARVALPVLALASNGYPLEFVENALAHLALLDPRLFVQALRFGRPIIGGRHRQVRRLVEAYLRARETAWQWWERATLQHRDSMKALYALGHVKPAPMAQRILFDRDPPHGTVFHDLKLLAKMSAAEVAAVIIRRRIPFLVAQGALGSRFREPDVVLALIKQMSPTEVVTNMKMLERLGVRENAILRAALEEALEKVARSKKVTLKTTRAADHVDDERLHKKLVSAQEKQLQALGGIDGNWLILGDRSGSMITAIDAARLVAGTLAKLVNGDVHLVFFNTTPTYYPVRGLDYEEIRAKTRHVVANGGTSIGCGLLSILERGIEVDGIAVVSDMAENAAPRFVTVYRQYEKKFGATPPIYLYRLPSSDTSGNIERELAMEKIDCQVFDLRNEVDYYSLPNVVKTMRASRYQLADEIMGTPLVTLEEALKRSA